MVVGSGLLAKAFLEYENYDNIVVFASGVSNSKEISRDEFDREEKLLNDYLEKYGKNKHFIYFSTCSVYDTYFERNEYTTHKINMEKTVVDKAFNYNIFRLPQVLGKNNKNQLIGFLYEQIKNKKKFELFNIERNIIDIQDICFLVNTVLKEGAKNEIINIANIDNTKVVDLVNIIEQRSKEKAIYTLKNIEGSFNVDIQRIMPIIEKNRVFEENYIENRIKKYYE